MGVNHASGTFDIYVEAFEAVFSPRMLSLLTKINKGTNLLIKMLKCAIMDRKKSKRGVIMLQFLLTLTDESNHRKVEHIYNTYHDYMIKYAVSKLRAAGRTNFMYDAEDAVQNSFVKIVKHIDKIDFSRGEKDVKNYCLTILCNEVCNVLNDNEENYEFDEEFCSGNEYNIIEELEMRENYNEVVKAIKALDEKYSTTMYLVFCKENTVNQVAELMGLSPKTVYTRLARGRQLLLDYLKGAK